MLLDPNLTVASDTESSLAEDSFGNEQVAEADEQIYADEVSSDKQPQQKEAGPASSDQQKDQILQRAREIAKQEKAKKEKKQLAKTNKSASASERPAHQASIVSKAKQAAEKAKKAKTKEGGGGESESGAADHQNKSTLDKAQLIRDATHGDPRKVVGDILDQKLHAGRRVGDALFGIWAVLTIITFPTIIGGLFSLFMLNLLLVSPNTNYRITRWLLEFILDFVGVGEVLTVLAQSGVTKIDVKLHPMEKLGIIAIDFGFFIALMTVITLVVTLLCYGTGLDGSGWVATFAGGPAGWLIDWYRGDSTGSTIVQACQSFNTSK